MAVTTKALGKRIYTKNKTTYFLPGGGIPETVEGDLVGIFMYFIQELDADRYLSFFKERTAPNHIFIQKLINKSIRVILKEKHKSNG